MTTRPRELFDRIGASLEYRKQFISRTCAKLCDRAQQMRSKEGSAKLNRDLVRLLDLCHELEVSPPEELIGLVKRQLSVSENPRKASRARDARRRAIEIKAKDPKLSSRKLAQACGASLPTVSKWIKNLSFQEGVHEETDLQAECADLSKEEKKVLAKALRELQ